MASTTTTTDLIAASRALDPAGRALLNLWLHRGLDDAAIASLAGGSAADVAERRRLVVERLAAEVGDSPEAIRAALDDLAFTPARAAAPASPVRAAPPAPEGLILPGETEPAAAPEDLVIPGEPEPVAAPEDLVIPGQAEPAAEPDDLVLPGEPAEPPADPPAVVIPPAADRPRPEPPAEKQPDPAPARPVARRSPIPATLGIALGLVIGGTVLAASIGGGGGGEKPQGSAPTPSATATAAAPRPQRLEPVPGGPDRVTGTMAVRAGTIRLDVDGLDRPRGDYEVWLYNSLADARPLGKLTSTSFELPPQARDFAFLDVSLEGDANANHSGRSVLRARLPQR